MSTPFNHHIDPTKMTWGTRYLALPDSVSGYKQLAQSPDAAEHHESDSEWQTNARRLAACWNKFQGLDTEAIESMPGPVIAMMAMYLQTQTKLYRALQLLANNPDSADAMVAALEALATTAPFSVMPEADASGVVH